MEIKCPYCGGSFDSTHSTCPHCGAPNMDGAVQAEAPRGKPKTIGELKAFCRRHNMPLSQMRFFIGQDNRGSRAFGIYQDEDGRFVVYKNKADGSRAVRYRGFDEAFAVGELYDKLYDEVQKRRSGSSVTRASGGRTRRSSSLSRILLIGFVIAYAVTGAYLALRKSGPKRGYYHYDNDYYYYQRGDWYTYDDSLSDWLITSAIDEQLSSHYRDYYESDRYDVSYPVEDFSDSVYYDPYDDSDSSWSSSDDDWDYDYDSWDSSDTDWDSDW